MCRSSGHIEGGTLSPPHEESTFADGSVTFALQDNNAGAGAGSGVIHNKSPPHRAGHDHGARHNQRADFTIPPPIPERGPSPSLPAPEPARSPSSAAHDTQNSGNGGSGAGRLGDGASPGAATDCSGEKEVDFRLHSCFPQLPWSSPLTYMLTMRACLNAEPAERPKFEQVRLSPA